MYNIDFEDANLPAPEPSEEQAMQLVKEMAASVNNDEATITQQKLNELFTRAKQVAEPQPEKADFRSYRRPGIKLNTVPAIHVVCPVGPKIMNQRFECPEGMGGCGKVYESQETYSAQGLVPFEWAVQFNNWVIPLNTSMTYSFKTNMLSARSREIMTQEILSRPVRNQPKYILYVDDDVIIPPLGVATLHDFMERNPHAGAVSGVYFSKGDTLCQPVIYREHGKGPAWDLEMGEGATPEPIWGAGAGCLLVRTEALRHLNKTEDALWMDKLVSEPGKKSIQGHDIRLCMLLNDAGWTVYGHGGVLCGHFDYKSRKLYEAPLDAPGRQKVRRKNINTQHYWDEIYGREGANTWRKYPMMFEKAVSFINQGDTVVELGCGVGILGGKLTAQKAVNYTGYDISQTAVEAARARFLNVHRLDVRELTQFHLIGTDVVVATELMEHLDEEVFDHVVSTVLDASSPVFRFIFTVPDNCMGPEQVPEHTALFNEKLVRERLQPYLESEAWNLRVDKADDNHIICVVERK